MEIRTGTWGSVCFFFYRTTHSYNHPPHGVYVEIAVDSVVIFWTVPEKLEKLEKLENLTILASLEIGEEWMSKLMS